MITIYNEDCIEGVKRDFCEDSVDLIVTDPPYNLNFHGTTQTKTKKPRFHEMKNDNMSHREYMKFTFSWLKEAFRILKPGCHIYVCIDWRSYPYVALAMNRVGFVIKNCIVWDKVHFGLGWQYRFRHEFIIFAVKSRGKVRRIHSRKTPDVLSIAKISGNKTIHPSEKPVQLIEVLIENSSNPGEHIVDFFMGSGAVMEAAFVKERNFTGYEMDPYHFATISKRIEELQ